MPLCQFTGLKKEFIILVIILFYMMANSIKFWRGVIEVTFYPTLRKSI